MTFGAAVTTGFKKYARFRGTASRSEFWYWRLFALLLSIVTSTFDNIISQKTGNSSPMFTPVSTAASLLIALPDLAITVRRFHDGGHSGHWLWINLVPVAFFIPLLNGVVEYLADGRELPTNSLILNYSALGFLVSFVAVVALQVSFLLQKTKTRQEGNRFASE